MYKILYSPAPLSPPQASRAAWAQTLAAEPRGLYRGEMEKENPSAATGSSRTTEGRQVQLVFFSEEVLFHLVLTLILKVLLPNSDTSNLLPPNASMPHEGGSKYTKSSSRPLASTRAITSTSASAGMSYPFPYNTYLPSPFSKCIR